MFLGLFSAQRPSQSPADAATITAFVEAISFGANGSRADAQFRCPAASGLPAEFLEIPTVHLHILHLPSHIGRRHRRICTLFTASGGYSPSNHRELSYPADE
jgi:hypothetical protein